MKKEVAARQGRPFTKPDNEFQAWMARTELPNYRQAADVLGISFASARSYGDGTRVLPEYIRRLMACVERERGAPERIGPAEAANIMGNALGYGEEPEQWKALQAAFTKLARRGVRLCRG